MHRNDEFYIGYAGPIPARMSRRVRAFVLTALGAGLAATIIVVGAQAPFAASAFDFGHPREASGTLVADPYPALLVAGDPGRRTWLVAPGKFGAEALVTGATGREVRLQGTEIRRGEWRMLELVPGTLAASDAAPATHGGTTPLGPATLRGEIVDSKCFLGVMNPGERAVHRDCAVRCISGGAPPMLIARDAEGRELLVTLVSSSGAAVGRQLLGLVAQPVEVSGQLERRDGALFLRADRAAYRRLSK